MGKESLQISKHIEEERARLDMNIGKLEQEFAAAKEFVTCLKNPATLVGIAIVVAFAIAQEISRMNKVKPIQSTTKPACDTAA